MRLIDAEELAVFLESLKHPKLPTTEGFTYITIADAIKVVSKRTTVPAIQIDRIKKLREEIEEDFSKQHHLISEDYKCVIDDERGVSICVARASEMNLSREFVLMLIDRLIKEYEG